MELPVLPAGVYISREFGQELFVENPARKPSVESFRVNARDNSLESQLAKINDPELTPSARILREMRERDLPFFKVAMAYSEQWAAYFRERGLAKETRSRFEEETRRSLDSQQELERGDGTDFDTYLETFYAQYKSL